MTLLKTRLSPLGAGWRISRCSLIFCVYLKSGRCQYIPLSCSAQLHFSLCSTGCETLSQAAWHVLYPGWKVVRLSRPWIARILGGIMCGTGDPGLVSFSSQACLPQAVRRGNSDSSFKGDAGSGQHAEAKASPTETGGCAGLCVTDTC